MRENRITIVINKPVEEVFDFTTNPINTHLWIPSISEECADEYPPKVNTRYRNRGKDSDWDYYKVVEFEKNKIFVLSDLDENYFVKYTFKKITNTKTEMEYYEWVKKDKLKNPFDISILENLKKVLENKK